MFRNFLYTLTALMALFQRGYCNSIESLQMTFREKMCRAIVSACRKEEAEADCLKFSSKKAIVFFQNLEKNYQEKIDSFSEEYIAFYGIKGGFFAPNFDDTQKTIILKFFHLRDDYFQSILKLCDSYKEVENSKKIREKINEISSKVTTSDWEDILFIIYGKIERGDIPERELIQNLFIEKEVKSIMIENQEKDEDILECYQKIYDESFYLALFDLFSRSNSSYLNNFYLKYHPIKSVNDFFAEYFTFFSTEDEYSSDQPFDVEVFKISEEYLQNLSKLADSLEG
jgi:hypothetical protein